MALAVDSFCEADPCCDILSLHFSWKPQTNRPILCHPTWHRCRQPEIHPRHSVAASDTANDATMAAEEKKSKKKRKNKKKKHPMSEDSTTEEPAVVTDVAAASGQDTSEAGPNNDKDDNDDDNNNNNNEGKGGHALGRP
jgi:hypothetical protein